MTAPTAIGRGKRKPPWKLLASPRPRIIAKTGPMIINHHGPHERTANQSQRRKNRSHQWVRTPILETPKSPLRIAAPKDRKSRIWGLRIFSPPALFADWPANTPIVAAILESVRCREVPGGGSRTRTYEGIARGFTVLPLCRSGHSPGSSEPVRQKTRAMRGACRGRLSEIGVPPVNPKKVCALRCSEEHGKARPTRLINHRKTNRGKAIPRPPAI